jgi:hypothetical protein
MSYSRSGLSDKEDHLGDCSRSYHLIPHVRAVRLIPLHLEPQR